MDDSLLYNWDELFTGSDFPRSALDFFRAVGHSIAVSPLIVANDILYCIYSELKFNAYFERSERVAFSCIKALSHSFTLDSREFYDDCNMQVDYYAVDINTARSERTVVANTILNAFTKNTSDYIVILFRQGNKCMLTFGQKANGGMTFLSDWFDEASVLDIIRKIDIANLSLQNSDIFFRDFIYMASRDYYKCSPSWEEAEAKWIEERWMKLYYSSCANDDGNNGFDDDFNTCSKKEFIHKIVFAHIYQYGDDYLDFSYDYEQQVNLELENDYDFDLLELELDELMASGALEFEDHENDSDDEDDLLDGYEQIDAKNIPPEIINDPVKLLDWLRERERAS